MDIVENKSNSGIILFLEALQYNNNKKHAKVYFKTCFRSLQTENFGKKLRLILFYPTIYWKKINKNEKIYYYHWNKYQIVLIYWE